MENKIKRLIIVLFVLSIVMSINELANGYFEDTSFEVVKIPRVENKLLATPEQVLKPYINDEIVESTAELTLEELQMKRETPDFCVSCRRLHPEYYEGRDEKDLDPNL